MCSSLLDYSVTVFVFAHPGGKKKPLKAPKKQSKEMEEVSVSKTRLSTCCVVNQMTHVDKTEQV